MFFDPNDIRSRFSDAFAYAEDLKHKQAERNSTLAKVQRGLTGADKFNDAAGSVDDPAMLAANAAMMAADEYFNKKASKSKAQAQSQPQPGSKEKVPLNVLIPPNDRLIGYMILAFAASKVSLATAQLCINAFTGFGGAILAPATAGLDITFEATLAELDHSRMRQELLS